MCPVVWMAPPPPPPQARVSPRTQGGEGETHSLAGEEAGTQFRRLDRNSRTLYSVIPLGYMYRHFRLCWRPYHCWRVKSSFKLVLMESTYPFNSLFGYSLKWRCCVLVWPKSLLHQMIVLLQFYKKKSIHDFEETRNSNVPIHCCLKKCKNLNLDWNPGDLLTGSCNWFLRTRLTPPPLHGPYIQPVHHKINIM